MAGYSTYKAIELMIESFSNFIERVFIGNGQISFKENDLKKSLNNQAGITLKELIELPFTDLKAKLDKVDVNLLNHIVIFLFKKTINKNVSSYNKNRAKNLNTRNLELIEYLDSSRNNFSLERCNIKNSLQHDI